MVKQAIIRPPGKSFKQCLSTHPLHHSLSLELALEQHQNYCRTLEDLGLELIELEPDNQHPDACFVEDTIVVHGKKAIIGRMAKESRRGESKEIEEILSETKELHTVDDPGTLEGGDVAHLPNLLLCGLTKRTNNSGAQQMGDWLEVPVLRIEDPNIMHLKSHLTYLENNTILINPKYHEHPELEAYNKIILHPQEAHSANTITIDGVVVMSHRHIETAKLVRAMGFDVVHLNMSEFEKCDGALTCLSIIF